MQSYGDNFIPIIPNDYPIHTVEHPNCSNTDCPCYDGIKQELTEQYLEGLVSPNDATRILGRRQIWQ